MAIKKDKLKKVEFPYLKLTPEDESDFVKRIKNLFLRQEFVGKMRADNVFAARNYDAVVDKEGKGDYTDIKSALDAGKTKIFLRAGTYIIDEAITITKSNVLIIGEDWSNTILKAKTALNDSIIVLGDGSNAYSNITIYNLQIDGDQTNQTGGTDKGLIHITKGISHLLIERCEIKNMYSRGIYATGAGATVLSNSSIIGCKIHDAKQNISYPDGAGIVIDFSNKIIIKDNYIYECGAGRGIDVDDTTEVIIANNFIYSTKNGGRALDIGSSYGTVTGNRIKDNDGDGISCNGGFMTISGNYVSNSSVNSASTHPSEIFVLNYATVIGNVCKITTADRSDYCIYVASGNNSVVGNICRDDTHTKIGIEIDASYNSITGNNVVYCDIGIHLTSDADYNVVVSNRSQGFTNSILNEGANNDVAHNT